jgi:4-amino-4-deoxy-L-arabinose transferase-like glycosyltransferase
MPEHLLSRRLVLFFLFATLGIIYLYGLFVDVMDVDSAQYAGMSMEMLQKKSFLHLYDRGQPYLDKPPLIFWLSSLSFRLFGISNFTFKLPSFLFSILGVYSVYRIGKLWFTKETGIRAALIIASCQTWFLFNNDVRTDTLLTASVIFAVWHLSAYMRQGGFWHFMGAFVGIGLAMLAKGPIGLMVPVFAFGTEILLKRNWKMIFRPEWLAGLCIIVLMLSPMVIGLYQQWGMKGVRFYFWTQSFGRITGENVWANDASPFYFLHNFLWAFLPWTFYFIFAFALELKQLWLNKFRIPQQQEGFLFGGFLITFVALSLSHYKLPHYIFVTMPFAALLTAKHLGKTPVDMGVSKIFRIISRVNFIVIALLLPAVLFLVFYIFPGGPLYIVVFSILLFLAAFYVYFRSKDTDGRILLPALLGIMAANLSLDGYIYPKLLVYQNAREVGEKVRSNGGEHKFYVFGPTASHSLDFYSRQIVQDISLEVIRQKLTSEDLWIYTDAGGLDQLRAIPPDEKGSIEEYKHFEVALLTIPFLNPASRDQHISKHFLLHLVARKP